MFEFKKTYNFVMPEVIHSVNKGEAAILYGIIECYKCIGDNNITVFSENINEDTKAYEPYSVNVVPFEKNRLKSSRFYLFRRISDIYSFLQFAFAGFISLFGSLIHLFPSFQSKNWKSLYDAHIILLAHDNLIVSKLPPRYIAILVFAKITRKLIVVPAASIGPINSKIHSILIRFFLRNVDLITIRDTFSYQYLKRLRIKNSIVHLTGDLAFLMKPAPRLRIQQIFDDIGIDSADPILGIALGNIGAHAGEAESVSMEQIISIISQLITEMQREYGCSVLLITHSLGPEQEANDKIIANKIYALINEKDKLRIIGEKYNARELKGIIGQLDMLIASRTHALIAALSSATPAIALTTKNRYKTVGIFGQMMGQDRHMYFLEDISIDSLKNKVIDAWHKRPEIRKDIRRHIPSIMDAANQNGKLLQELIVRKSV